MMIIVTKYETKNSFKLFVNIKNVAPRDCPFSKGNRERTRNVFNPPRAKLRPVTNHGRATLVSDALFAKLTKN